MPGSTRPRLSGSCLCEGVRFTVGAAVRDVVECHCQRCRKTTGNFMAATAAPRSAISFLADGTLRWFAPADDPDVAYGFCERCGSSLFWRHVGSTDPDPSISICAGALESPTGLRTTEVWFADEAADHVTITSGVPRHRREPPATIRPQKPPT
jgi:hypothetical protein